jgi:hypothetical protein
MSFSVSTLLWVWIIDQGLGIAEMKQHMLYNAIGLSELFKLICHLQETGLDELNWQ